MLEKGYSVSTFFGVFRVIWNNWNVDEFSEAVYASNYREEMTSRQAYLLDKYGRWKKNPALFYFELDETNQLRYAIAMEKLAAEYNKQHSTRKAGD